jgi:hypothetical protein
MKSDKPVKNIDDLVGGKVFFFPDSLSNERVGNDNQKCIMLRINGKSHFILTNRNVSLTDQEFAVFRDAGMISGSISYEVNSEFDPLRKTYDKRT